MLNHSGALKTVKKVGKFQGNRRSVGRSDGEKMRPWLLTCGWMAECVNEANLHGLRAGTTRDDV
jgi:hypothetical protein